MAKKTLDSIFEALANRHRRSIVHHLSLFPATITELADKEKLTLPAIHKHIKLLEDAKLVMRKKTGRTNFLALHRSGLQSLREWVDQYHSYWGSDSETLANYINHLSKNK